LSDVLSKSKAL